MARKPDVREDIEAGRRVRVLEDRTPNQPPLSLCYPSRWNPTAAFRAFIGFARKRSEASDG